MRAGPTFRCWRKPLWIGLLTCICASTPLAAATWHTTFDNAGSVAWWWLPAYGSPTPTAGWDGSQDASNFVTSGSLKCAENFTGADAEYFAICLLLLDASNSPVVLSAPNYIRLNFDLKVAPETAPSPHADYGWLVVDFISTSLSNPFVGGLQGPVQLPLSATNWTRFSLPVLVTAPGLDQVCGLRFSMYSSTNTSTWLTNGLTFNIDNLELYTVCCAPPGPFRLTSSWSAAEGYRLSWPIDWAGSLLQTSSDLVHWTDTGWETNALQVGNSLEVVIPLTALPASNNAFWRLRLPRP